jgi:hypothetical protein
MPGEVWIVGAPGGLLLATWNTVVTRRLWLSPMYERRQRIAQTTIIWLMPGTAFFVNWLLRGMPERSSVLDPTANDGATDYSKQGVNIHPHGPF